MMQLKSIHEVMRVLGKESKRWRMPSVTQISLTKDPFKILISTLLSLRTKDEVTLSSSVRLFEVADTPQGILKLSEQKIAKLIYPAAFYRTKAKRIREICKVLIDEHKGKVPNELEDLLKFKGVGRKTANLVITLGFQKLGICVDTHVHRISNRLGIVKTKTPEQTEFALRKILPEKYWISYNDYLVAFGQTLCRPISPWCSKCPIHALCARRGVSIHR